jgi:hypothetical protein
MTHGTSASINGAQGSKRRWRHGQGAGASLPCATVQSSMQCLILWALRMTGNSPKGVFSGGGDRGRCATVTAFPWVLALAGTRTCCPLAMGQGQAAEMCSPLARHQVRSLRVACRGMATARGGSLGFRDERLKFLRWAQLYI